MRPSLLLTVLLVVGLGCGSSRPSASQLRTPTCALAAADRPARAEYATYRPVAEADRTAPFSSVCQIDVGRKYFGRGDYPRNSSAFRVEGGLLVTAAHNVHEGLVSRTRRRAFRCGGTPEDADWRATATPFDRDDVEVAEGYHFVLPPASRDYAAIRLDAPPPDTSAFRLLVPGRDALACGDTVHVAGHPSGQDDTPADQMHVASGIVTRITETQLFYAITTQGGNSGGPVWVETEDGEHVVVGVHIRPSQARLVTQDMIDDIEAWSTASQ